MEKRKHPSDIPLFIKLVSILKPRFFVMDNLPGAICAVGPDFWSSNLSSYDIFFEWVSNYHYGNLQIRRNRLFIIGCLRGESFTFVPGEKELFLSMKEILSDLLPVSSYGRFPNHSKLDMKERVGVGKRMNFSGCYDYRSFVGFDTLLESGEWSDVRRYFSAVPEGHVMTYINKEGRVARRAGTSKPYWSGHSHVIDGSSPSIHPKKNLPFTIRERARIQGCPDDFVFIGEKLNSKGEWGFYKNSNLIKQTGKFMPVQFCRYISEQIMAYMKGRKFKCSGRRLIKENQSISEAKKWYCENVGYSNQKLACKYCWLDCGR